MLRLNNAILFVRLSNKLIHVSLFPEFINIVSIMFYNFIEFIILLHSFLVISFARHKGFGGVACFYLCKCYWSFLKHLFMTSYFESFTFLLFINAFFKKDFFNNTDYLFRIFIFRNFLTINIQ